MGKVQPVEIVASVPYAVSVVQDDDSPPVRVAGKTVKVGPVAVLTGAAALYAATDAFGPKFRINVPKSGIIQSVRLFDPDDDTFTLTVHLFNGDFTASADNAVYDVADAEYLKLEASILVDTFRDMVTSKLGVEDNLGIAYTAPLGYLWGQCQLQSGTPTIASGVNEYLWLYILADD